MLVYLRWSIAIPIHFSGELLTFQGILSNEVKEVGIYSSTFYFILKALINKHKFGAINFALFSGK